MTLCRAARRAGGASPRTPAHLAAALSLTISLGACALATPPLAVPPEEALPGLEAAVSQDPTHLQAALELALGYVASDRLEEARRLLQAAHLAVPSDRTVLALLGMVEHRLDLHVEADARFETFLDAHPQDPAAPVVRTRWEAVRPLALLGRARARLAEPPDSREGAGSARVAVLPFRVRGGYPDGESLGAAFAELTAIGLDSADLQVIDPREGRAVLEALGRPLDQPLSLGEAALVGALLDAGEVVHGVLDFTAADSLTVEGVVLGRDEEAISVTVFEVAGRLADATSLQKRLAVVVHGILQDGVGIEEAALVGLGSWPGTPALAAFGEGLLLEARGDLAGAAAAHERALAGSAAFAAAAERAERVRQAIEVTEGPLLTAALEVARIGELQRSLVALQGRPGSAAESAARRLGALDRALAAELLGLDRLGAGVSYELIFTLPPAGP